MKKLKRKDYLLNQKENIENEKKHLKNVFDKFSVVCQVSGMKISGTSRKKDIIDKRHIFHYLAHRCIGFKCHHVGEITNKSHASVLHSCRIVDEQKKYFSELLNEINERFKYENKYRLK